MTEAEARKIVTESRRRLARLTEPYNPLTGEGSPIPRVPLRFDAARSVLIPDYIARTPTVQAILAAGSVERYAAQNGVGPEELAAAIHRLRAVYDFEFWCATCVKIFDKLSGRLIPLILRKAQRKIVAVMIRDLFSGKPVRIILLKARQLGGSTAVQMMLSWIQTFHRRRWNSVIVADVEDQARNIRAMYSNMARHHPSAIYPIRFRNHEGSSKNREIIDRGCVVSIGSAQRPDSLRSGDIKLAHLSEIGLWKRTKERKPEDVIQTIIGSIPREPFTAVVMESTAKGIGNYFHEAWTEATAGRNAYTPVFVAWWEIDLYLKPFPDEAARLAFARSLTRDELNRFELGATLEGLNWYREKRAEYSTDWQMCSEYPGTPDEAFQTSGHPAHDPLYVRQMRGFCKPAPFTGEIIGSAPYGGGALRDIHFVPSPAGGFLLWKMPDTARPVRDRYVVSLDIGGRNPLADYSVISVIDRAPLMQGGVEECIATWRGHLDQDLIVWKAVQVARWFCNALLVVEANSLNPKGQEGDHILTILDEIKDHYDNLFARTDPALIREGRPARFGFHTNAASKTDLINQMNRRLREQGYIERDSRALDEAAWYEVKPNGSYGAIENRHDDIHMSRMIALKVSQLMDPPLEIPARPRRPADETVRTEASM